MIYGTETWALTTQTKNKLAATHKWKEVRYAKHHTAGQKNKHLGKRKDTGHRRD